MGEYQGRGMLRVWKNVAKSLYCAEEGHGGRVSSSGQVVLNNLCGFWGAGTVLSGLVPGRWGDQGGGLAARV